MKIFKFPIAITDYQEVEMPEYSSILSVQFQNGQLCIWAMVEDEQNETRHRKIKIFGTGNSFKLTNMVHLGTVQQNIYVWHIFEEMES